MPPALRAPPARQGRQGHRIHSRPASAPPWRRRPSPSAVSTVRTVRRQAEHPHPLLIEITEIQRHVVMQSPPRGAPRRASVVRRCPGDQIPVWRGVPASTSTGLCRTHRQSTDDRVPRGGAGSSSMLTTAPNVIVRTVDPGSEARAAPPAARGAPPGHIVVPKGSLIMYELDLERRLPSMWPRRLTVVGYLVIAVVVALSVIRAPRRGDLRLAPYPGRDDRAHRTSRPCLPTHWHRRRRLTCPTGTCCAG